MSIVSSDSSPGADNVKCFVPTTKVVESFEDGKLANVRVALKDLFAVEAHTSSFGHPRWRETHQAASETASVVQRMLSAGASVVGLTKMDQLAYSLIGNVGEGEPPINSFDPECYCGGSSSGSASAVAGNLADLGVGTDTAGSIRVPAAACGLFGIRTTHGAVDKEGVIPLAPSLDVIGYLARSPHVLRDAFSVTSPSTPSWGSFGGVLVPSRLSEGFAPEYLDSLRLVGERLASQMGCSIEAVDCSSLVDAEVGDLFARIQSREIWNEHGSWVDANLSYLAPDVQSRLRRSRELSGDPGISKTEDREARSVYTHKVSSLLQGNKVLVLPVVPRRGPMVRWTDDELLSYRVACFRLTGPSSLTGFPQVVIPTSRDTGNVPAVGVLGPAYSDLGLIELARDYAAGA